MSNKINLLLRGHIRNSFNDDNFYLLLKEITRTFQCDIYIHTWNVVQTSRSWRYIKENKTNVDKKHIQSYFRDV